MASEINYEMPCIKWNNYIDILILGKAGLSLVELAGLTMLITCWCGVEITFGCIFGVLEILPGFLKFCLAAVGITL